MPNPEIIEISASPAEDLQAQTQGGLTVRELHIDFLLQEEFSADPEFLRRFIEQAADYIKEAAKHLKEPIGDPKSSDALSNVAIGPLEVECVGHSVSDQHGEADLIVIFRQANSPQRRIALLIEDKIRARFQPRQPERYRARGEFGMKSEWNQYWTVLVAPESYIKHGHGFDTAVTLEQISSFLSMSEPRRRDFKAQVIAQAINVPDNGVKVVDPTITGFRASYFTFFEEFFKHRRQDVSMRAPAPTWKGDVWFEIRSPMLPKGAYVNHKSDRGFVDLTFPSTDAERLRATESFLESGMSVHQTYNSSAIRIQVPAISNFVEFAEERDKVTSALSAVTKLIDFYATQHLRLDPLLKKASTSGSAALRDIP